MKAGAACVPAANTQNPTPIDIMELKASAFAIDGNHSQISLLTWASGRKA
jgi:hypothetical protein